MSVLVFVQPFCFCKSFYFVIFYSCFFVLVGTPISTYQPNSHFNFHIHWSITQQKTTENNRKRPVDPQIEILLIRRHTTLPDIPRYPIFTPPQWTFCSLKEQVIETMESSLQNKQEKESSNTRKRNSQERCGNGARQKTNSLLIATRFLSCPSSYSQRQSFRSEMSPLSSQMHSILLWYSHWMQFWLEFIFWLFGWLAPPPRVVESCPFTPHEMCCGRGPQSQLGEGADTSRCLRRC